MFASRLITLLVATTCAVLAYCVTYDVSFFHIPLLPLKALVATALSFFSVSALVMWVGLTDSRKTEDGVLEFGDSRRGRIMASIAERVTRNGGEAHCCDLYLGTSGATFMAVLGAVMLAMLVSFLIAETLKFVLVFGVIAAVIGAVVGLIVLDEKGYLDFLKSKNPRPRSARTEKILDRCATTFMIIVCVVCAGSLLTLFVYLPIVTIMELGYTLLGATLLYLLAVALMPMPLYCLLGKRVLLKTKVGQSVCPVVR